MCFKSKLINYIRCGQNLAIRTIEEKRAKADIISAIFSHSGKEPLFEEIRIWNFNSGICTVTKTDDGNLIESEYVNSEGGIIEILNEYIKPVNDGAPKHTNSLVIFEDLQLLPLTGDSAAIDVVVGLKKALLKNPKHGSLFIFLGESVKIHSVFSDTIQILDYVLPTSDELADIYDSIVTITERRDGKKLEFTPEEKDAAVKAALGLTYLQAENAFSLAAIESEKSGKITISPEVVSREKIAQIKKSDLLEFISPDKSGFDSIGGLENLKDYILLRKNTFNEKAKEYGLPVPKGVLVLGVPGSGKSCIAKCVGTILNIPTIKLDIGNLFNSLVGESERRTRSALSLVDSIQPCILFVDELDKGLAGTKQDFSGDSGVTKRIFGTILNWLQEKESCVYVIATANNVKSLPPELLRKGRFDEIFTVDLPNREEREEIFKIHLKKRGRNPEDFDTKLLSQNSESEGNGMTGSEIEQAVIEAMYVAFNKDREVTTGDIIESVEKGKRGMLCKIAKEDIEAIREFGNTRGTPANKPLKHNYSMRKIK